MPYTTDHKQVLHHRVTFSRVASLVSLTGALWTGSAVAAQACICVGSPDPKGAVELTNELKSDLDAAFVVFVGEPIARNSLTIRFRVNAVWKGNSEARWSCQRAQRQPPTD